MKNSTLVISRVLTGLTVVALVFALNVSGALAGFWRTLDGISANGISNPSSFLYGVGSNGTLGYYGYGYGYGYGDFGEGYGYGSAGYGYGDFAAGYVVVTSSSSGGGSFPDTSSNWASDYIDTLADLGIVVGNEDGAFEPDRNVTRAEFLKMSLLAFGKTYSSADSANETFPDVVDGTWISNVVGKAQSLGIVDGYGVNEFNPNALVTRAEAMKMLVRTAGLTLDTAATSSFADVTLTWQIKYIEAALDAGIISAATNFRPEDAITRAESAKVIAIALTTMSK